MEATKFKDAQNRWYTIGLFKETAAPEHYSKILFTLEEAKNLFLKERDVTGYSFSNKYLGGWKHLKALKNSPRLRPIIKEWEEELEVMLRSEAITHIIDLSKSDKGYQAAKFLADRGYRDKTVGRRTKEAIEKQAKEDAALYREFDNVTKIK